MPAVAYQRPRLSPQDYLVMERAADFKSEYADGEVFAMSGGSLQHSLIAGNLHGELRQGLKGRPCMVLNSDMKTWIAEADKFAYPDVSALCGEPEFFDDSKDVITNPSFVAEVLSPSTEAYDRGEKFRKYGRLDSLREYLLLSQSRPLAELYERQADDTWLLRVFDQLGQTLTIPSLQCEVSLEELYAKVEFEPVVEQESNG